jgi:hypothetical protein
MKDRDTLGCFACLSGPQSTALPFTVHHPACGAIRLWACGPALPRGFWLTARCEAHGFTPRGGPGEPWVPLAAGWATPGPGDGRSTFVLLFGLAGTSVRLPAAVGTCTVPRRSYLSCTGSRQPGVVGLAVPPPSERCEQHNCQYTSAAQSKTLPSSAAPSGLVEGRGANENRLRDTQARYRGPGATERFPVSTGCTALLVGPP